MANSYSRRNELAHRMHRFFLGQRINADSISISDAKQLHHLKDVLRLQVNDEVIVFDDEGNEYICVIAGLSREKATLTVKAQRPAQGTPIAVTIACAIPKRGRMDEIIDRLTQLGVASIVPMQTERVIVRLDDSKKAARLERWRRIAKSAAQQSQRATIPLVAPLTRADEVIRQSQDFGLRLIATVSAEKPVKEVLAKSKPTKILVLIGPEGDFSPREVALAQSEGFIPISLGSSVLRVDTAAIAVASYINLSLMS